MISTIEKEDLEQFNIFLIGAVFGSFLNVLIYRLPLGISLFNPKRSACPNCKIQIKWYENLPIVSYIFLKGKCSNCKKKISIQYPLIEFFTALITLIIFNQFGFSLDTVFVILISYTLIVLSMIDYKYKAVPDYLLILVLIFAFFLSMFSFTNALIFAGAFTLLELFVTFYIQNIKAKITKDPSLEDQRAMGEGDIPVAALIGGILGIKLGIMAIVFGALFAIIHSIFNIIVKKEIETPFIPYLTLGFFVVLFFDQYLIGFFS
jgi:leader peptidase (prepilin peptidase)/N-methyltransferase